MIDVAIFTYAGAAAIGGIIGFALAVLFDKVIRKTFPVVYHWLQHDED